MPPVREMTPSSCQLKLAGKGLPAPVKENFISQARPHRLGVAQWWAQSSTVVVTTQASDNRCGRRCRHRARGGRHRANLLKRTSRKRQPILARQDPLVLPLPALALQITPRRPVRRTPV